MQNNRAIDAEYLLVHEEGVLRESLGEREREREINQGGRVEGGVRENERGGVKRREK